MSQQWDFTIKKDDTGPDLEVQFLDEYGDPVNITGYSALTFRMMNEKKQIMKVNDAATPVDTSIGRVKYVWKAVDTDEDAIYYGEFKVTLGTGQKVTFPNNGYIKIKVYESVPST